MRQRGVRLGAIAFFVVCAALLAALLVTGYRKQEEWKREQRRYNALRGESAELAVREITTHWEAEGDAVRGRVERCTTCHLGVEGPPLSGPAPRNLSPHPSEILEKHPIARFGCVACHGGRAEETTFAAHEGLARSGAAMPPPGALDWRRDKDELLAAVPTSQSACLKCHVRDPDLRPAASVARAKAAGAPPPPAAPDLAPRLSRGRALFRALQCAGCHALRGFEPSRSAPPLDDVAASHDPSFVLSFLRDPRAWHPGTTMPSFWPEPIDPVTLRKAPPEPAWRERMRTETLAIAAFLVERAAGRKRAEAFQRHATVPGASEEDGRALVEAYGCMRCHSREGSARDLAPPLASAGAEMSEDFLAYFVEGPRRWLPRAHMPSLRVTRREAASIARYLRTLRARPAGAAEVTPEEAASLSSPTKRAERVVCNLPSTGEMSRAQCGEALVSHYGCAGCHELEGHAQDAPAGPPLGAWATTRTIRELDFGLVPTEPRDRTRDLFAIWKLHAPRVFQHKTHELTMPDYALEADEVVDLTTFLLGLDGARPQPQLDPAQRPERQALLEGAQLVEDLGCRRCHVLDRAEAPRSSAPSLVAEGARVQAPWLFAFLRDPAARGVRPAMHPEWIYGDQVPLGKLALRMPTFTLTTQEATSIARFFAARDGADFPFEEPQLHPPTGEDRVTAVTVLNKQCMTCHYVGDMPLDRAKTDLSIMGPDLSRARSRLRTSWVKWWLAEPTVFGDAHGSAKAMQLDHNLLLAVDLVFALREGVTLPKPGEESRAPILGLDR
jgi:cytochrome c2